MSRQTGPVRHPLPTPGTPYIRPAVSPNDFLDGTLDAIRDSFVLEHVSPSPATGALLDAFDRIRSDRRTLMIDLEVLNLALPVGTDRALLEVALVEASRLRDETAGDIGSLTRPVPNPDGPARPSSPDSAPGPGS